jgi:predicted ArsR family transcriptional regulator
VSARKSHVAFGLRNFDLNASALRVLRELRHGPSTVEDLAVTLHLTANAVRNQLAKLVGANLVVRSGVRPSASKPSVLYSITIEGEAQFSTIYLPVLTHFLRVAEMKCPESQLSEFMNATGRSLVEQYPRPKGDLRSRAHAGARLLGTFGALPDVRKERGTLVIRSKGCPLAALTSDNPAACHVLEGLLTDYVGGNAKVCCTLDPEPRCCFEITG